MVVFGLELVERRVRREKQKTREERRWGLRHVGRV
jgi:hypothetical protein